jgi:hypothetical protein
LCRQALDYPQLALARGKDALQYFIQLFELTKHIVLTSFDLQQLLCGLR